jgi:hypothetical protein
LVPSEGRPPALISDPNSEVGLLLFLRYFFTLQLPPPCSPPPLPPPPSHCLTASRCLRCQLFPTAFADSRSFSHTAFTTA